MPPTAVIDAWVRDTFGVDPSMYQSPAAPAGAPTSDYTAGLNPPPADFATYPDEMKQMWERVKAGDKQARADWRDIMGTPESARQNKAGRAKATAELQQVKADAARDKGIIGAVSAVSPLGGAVLSEIGGLETIKELAKTDWGKEWNETALAIGGQVQKRVDGLAEDIVAVPDALAGAATKIKKGIDTLAEGIVALPDQAKAAAKSLKEAVSSLDAEQVGGMLDAAADKLSKTASDAVDALDKAATDLNKAAGAAFDKVSAQVANAIDDPRAAAKAAGEMVSGAIQSARDAVKSAGDAVSKADKAFWRSDPEKMRERLADYTVEAGSQAAQAVAFEGVAKGLGKGVELMRGGKAAAEGAEAVGAGAKVAKGARVAETEAAETAVRGAKGAGLEARVPVREPAPAFGANPEASPVDLTAGEQRAGAAERGARGRPAGPEKPYRPKDGRSGKFDFSPDAELDAPEVETGETVAPKRGEYNKLHEAQAKMLGAEREVASIAGVEERVAGGRAETVERAYQQYQDGLEKARQGLRDAKLRRQMSPEELKELEEAIRPDKVRTLDDFRKSAGLPPVGDAAPTVKMPPPGSDPHAPTQRFEPGKHPGIDPAATPTVKMPAPGEDPFAQTQRFEPGKHPGIDPAATPTVKMPAPGEDPFAQTQRFEPGKHPGIDPAATPTVKVPPPGGEPLAPTVKMPPPEGAPRAPTKGAKALDLAADPTEQAMDQAIAKLDAIDKIKAAKPAELKKLPNAEKRQLIKDLVGGGKQDADTRKALKKIYESMELDPQFMQKEAERSAKIADAFKGDKQLRQAGNNWTKLKPEDKVKSLKRIVAEQSKQYGIPPPEITLFDAPRDAKGLFKNGFFSGVDGKIHLNSNAEGALKDFERALDLVMHENAHNYQRQLVAKLEKGLIKVGDAEYEQAMMFAANAEEGAKIAPDLSNPANAEAELAAYRGQPKEAHSFDVGPKTARKIVDGL